MNPLFSIIIPVFNSGNEALRALESVLGQVGGGELEIIVVDDCSTDGSLSTLDAYAVGRPIRVLRSERNGGPGAARNRGLDMAKGEWILFLDSDDILESDALAALYAVAMAEPEAELIAFDWGYFEPTEGRSGPPLGQRDDLIRLIGEDQATVVDDYLLNRIDSSVIFHAFRRDLLSRRNLRFRGGYHEDVDYLFAALLEARGVAILERPLYAKHNRPLSIVNTLSGAHIRGYLAALEAMWCTLVVHGLEEAHRSAYYRGVVNVAASRLVRLVNPAVVKTEEMTAICVSLEEALAGLAQRIGQPFADFVEKTAWPTRYQAIYSAFVARCPVTDAAVVSALADELQSLVAKSWSCYDLQHSLFLAPDEIRTCCKRFYAEGRMKGDVALLRDFSADGRVTLDELIARKTHLIREINRDNAPECRGCPFLRFADWGKPLDGGVRYLSLEYHSVCNMRCTYCSDTFYGGSKAAYDVGTLIAEIAESGMLEHCDYLVWGGGEPTLGQDFDTRLRALSAATPSVRQRVISNCTKYSADLAELLATDRAYLVTSVDAGTAEVFQTIKHFRNFDRVIANISRYAAQSPLNVVIKYIVTSENRDPGELEAFADLMRNSGLLGCVFQISCDFRIESLAAADLQALGMLHCMLRERGAACVYWDDLVWQRVPLTDWAEELTNFLAARGWPQALANDRVTPEVAVWGIGAQAELLLHKTIFFRRAQVAYFVDPRPEKWGGTFMGVPIRSPEDCYADSRPVLIAAVQSTALILRDMLAAGFDPKRLLKDLVV